LYCTTVVQGKFGVEPADVDAAAADVAADAGLMQLSRGFAGRISLRRTNDSTGVIVFVLRRDVFTYVAGKEEEE